nr:hypothetical protein [Bacteroidota bacterium]
MMSEQVMAIMLKTIFVLMAIAFLFGFNQQWIKIKSNGKMVKYAAVTISNRTEVIMGCNHKLGSCIWLEISN